ncbi:MAG: flavin reductase family protein, partial [Solirubrobacteraceae bacterium]
NVLGEGKQQLSQRFAESGGDKFAGVSWSPAPETGAPLVEVGPAWIDCNIYRRYEAGDHWLVLGEVLELSGLEDAGALVFHSGVYRPLN